MGLLEAFAFAEEVARAADGSLAEFWQRWACAPPQGLLLAAAASSQLPPGAPQPPQGPWLGAAVGWPLRLSVPCFRVAYRAVLEAGVPPAAAGMQPPPPQQQAWQQQQQQHQGPPPAGFPPQQQQQQYRVPCGPVNPNTIPHGQMNMQQPCYQNYQQQQHGPPRPYWQQQQQQRQPPTHPPAAGGRALPHSMQTTPGAAKPVPDLELSQSASRPKRAFRSQKAQEANQAGGGSKSLGVMVLGQGDGGSSGSGGGGSSATVAAGVQQPQQRAKRRKAVGVARLNGGASALAAAADDTDDDFA